MRPKVSFARHGWLAAIAFVYLYAFPYFPRIHSANELPRVYLVKAIVDDHTLAIDRGVARWGATADVSPSGGHLYSNKAPGSSLLAVPAYAAVRAVAGEPSLAATMWICRVFAGILPMLGFLWLVWGFLARFAPDPAVRRVVVLGYALGSLAMTYSILFYSHQLGAICIASAWILALDVADGRRGLAAMAAAGLLAGAAPLVDYQAVFAALPIAVHVVVRLGRTRAESIDSGPQRSKDRNHLAARVPLAGTRAESIDSGPQRSKDRNHLAARVPLAGTRAESIDSGPQRSKDRDHLAARVPLAGTRRAGLAPAIAVAAIAAAVPIAGLLGYHAACFGSPWRTGYDASTTFAMYHQQGLLGITALRGEALWGSVGRPDNGLIALSPWWLLAVPGAVALWRRGQRGAALVGAAVSVIYLLFISSINFWRGGWEVGPRYIAAMLPFLLPAVAAQLDALRARNIALGAAAGLIGAGVVIYVLSAATFPYWPDSFRHPLYEVAFRLIGDHLVAPNLGGALGVAGLAGMLPYAAVAFGAFGAAVGRLAGARGLAACAVVAAAIVAGYGGIQHGGPAADAGYRSVRAAVLDL